MKLYPWIKAGKIRMCLIGADFLVKTDHPPLEELFRKAIVAIENENLRDLVVGLTGYSFDVENTRGESKFSLIGAFQNGVDVFQILECRSLEDCMKCFQETYGEDSYRETRGVLH